MIDSLLARRTDVRHLSLSAHYCFCVWLQYQDQVEQYYSIFRTQNRPTSRGKKNIHDPERLLGTWYAAILQLLDREPGP